MTISELNARIEKATEKIQKKTATIEKKETWIASGKKSEFEIEWLQDDIKRLQSEIAETQKTIEKYEKQLAGGIERERIILNEIPETMKALQTELVERWNSYDFERRAAIQKKYEELDYKEFSRQYKRSAIDFMRKTDKEITKENERDAKALIIDLYYRIRAITGEVINWNNIHCSGSALNGICSGKEGKAKITTIYAGGYNIQRLHIRVLVHSI